ncbi:MAG: long-chain-fatty-acid--CoA ligase [Bryobacteraceae bacterium]|nr:long-chain-fatty-acid--CoA ligase [Bryobacteraceae bacterium]
MNLMFTLRRANRFFGRRAASVTSTGPITWEAYFQRAHRAAAFLDQVGIHSGDRVAALMLNSHEYLELYHATMIRGAIIVPLNIRWNLDDFAFAVNDSESTAFVLDDRFAPLLPGLKDRCPGVRHWIFAGTGEHPAGMMDWNAGVSATDPREFPEPDEMDVVGIFYTSGTTGGPKGAMLTHRHCYSHAVHSTLSTQMVSDGTWLHAAPMFHLADAGAIHSVTMLGCTHAYLPAFDPEAFCAAVERHRVTETVLVPTMLNMVVNHPAVDRYDLSSMKNMLYGASPMPLPVLQKAMEKFPHARFRQGYGMTEAGPMLLCLQPEDHRLERLDEKFTPIKSAGRPAIGVEVRIVDEHDRDVPVGHSGEIIVRGAAVMKGYWKRPEISEEVLRGGWMHTGDIGAFDAEGFVYILDRKKDMIKSGGENVYSPEVESMLMSHPAVLEAAVIGVAHPKWGETIRAIVALRPGMQLSESELVAWSRERLTHFKCPSSAVFLDTLPKGGTGKVQKTVLREKYGQLAGGAHT